MARIKTKESETRCFRLRKDIGNRLDAYSEDTMIPKTAIVEKALLKYLDEVAPIITEKTQR